MYNLISSFFQGYYPLNNQNYEPDYLTVSDAQLSNHKTQKNDQLINNITNDIQKNQTQYESIHIDNNRDIDNISHSSESSETSNSESNHFKDYYFNHLNFMGQCYFFHFKQSIKYSFLACKASFYFFIHAIYPDIFQHTASDIIVGINDEILQTYKDCLDRIDREIFNV